MPLAVPVRADDTWYLQSVVAHFGGSMRGGRYDSAIATPPGDLMVANDAVLSGPMSIEEAFIALNSDPLLLIYTNDWPHGRKYMRGRPKSRPHQHSANPRPTRPHVATWFRLLRHT